MIGNATRKRNQLTRDPQLIEMLRSNINAAANDLMGIRDDLCEPISALQGMRDALKAGPHVNSEDAVGQIVDTVEEVYEFIDDLMGQVEWASEQLSSKASDLDEEYPEPAESTSAPVED